MPFASQKRLRKPERRRAGQATDDDLSEARPDEQQDPQGDEQAADQARYSSGCLKKNPHKRSRDLKLTYQGQI
eukprot:scaffold476909_cov18-Prasinocladus_malaysianus.AAC.1